MDRFGTLQLFTAVSLLGHVCHCWEANVPKTVTAVRDSCVLVPCNTFPYSKVIWYKYKSVGYPVVYSTVQSDIIDQFKGRTSVPGDAENGNCTLRINNVQKEDSEVDLFVWVWKRDGSDSGFEYHTTKINILNPTDPVITAESEQVEGKAFTAKCEFRTSCPTPPQMFWKGLDYISNKLIHTQNSETLWVNEITGTFTVTRKNQGARLSCTAELKEQEFQSTSVTLEVLYPPSILPGSFCSTSNRLLKCVCEAVAKPDAEISWTIDGSSTLSPALNTTTLHTDSVTVSELTGQWDSGGDITCTATNIAGSNVQQIHIHKWVDSLSLVAGVGAACVCGIVGLVTVIMICIKRRRAETPTDLIAVQTVRSAKRSHNYRLSLDEDLYVNAAQAEKECKEQDAESCIYANYDKRP